MPVTRRRFIQNGLGFVSLGAAMPGFLMRTADAVAAEKGAGGGKILVVIEMSGGNDGLNTVIPYDDPAYPKARPNIGLAKDDVLQIGKTPAAQSVALHPGMKALHGMFEKGQVAVVNGVGYPQPNRSHFYSMDIWQMGDPSATPRERTGWLARYFDADGHFKGNPLGGVVLGSELPLALQSLNSPVAVIGNGGDYGFGSKAADRKQQMEAFQSLYANPAPATGTVANGGDEFIRNVGNEVYTSTQTIKEALQKYDIKAGAAANYPNNNGLAARLQTIAKLITGGLTTRVYYAGIGGFDTHANQPNGHGNLLTSLSEAVAAFHRDLELQGRGKNVMTMTFSEFGRRVQENGSRGTDHGAASVMFAIGGGLRGGVFGEYPSLTNLDDGDLRFTTDFRGVYATVLDSWLAAPSETVLRGKFTPVKFV